jgi:UDP-glucose 4-epimerase
MILITGASGFIGRHLARELLSRGEHLVLCSHSCDLQNDFPGCDCIKTDLCSPSAAASLRASGIKAVIHLAACIPRYVSLDTAEHVPHLLDTNIIATRNVLEFCRVNRIRKMIFASTVSVYDHCSRVPPREGDPAQPQTFYGWSKLCAELLCERYRVSCGIACFSLRFASVYGPGQPDHLVVGRFVRQAQQGENITVWGRGTKLVDFVHVRDVVAACVAALRSDRPGVYNIGSGKPVTVAQLARCAAHLHGAGRSRVVFLRDKPGDDSARVILDVSKARRVLKFRPEYTLDRGLAEFGNL